MFAAPEHEVKETVVILKPVDYVPHKTAGKKPQRGEPVLVREPHGS